jgi:FMN phosphatase YigB (HAD superfamily)
MLNALVFDVDNTLTVGHWKPGLNEFLLKQLAKYGEIDKAKFNNISSETDSIIKEKDKKDIYYSDWMSLRLDKLLDGLKLSLALTDRENILRNVDNYIIDNTEELSNSTTILKELNKIYPLYIITNGSSRINGILEHLKIKYLFKGIFISEEMKTIKETGGLFETFIKNTKLNGSDCLMIGDKLISDGMCKSVGMFFCLIDRNKKSTGPGYDFKISDLSEIYTVIDALRKDTKDK